MKTIRVVCTLAALAICAVLASGGTASASTAPCGTLALSSTNYTHVVWIWMENHSYNEIIGSPEAPYINSIAGECGLATNYHNISHPSLPNYVAGTSPSSAATSPAGRCRRSRSSRQT